MEFHNGNTTSMAAGEEVHFEDKKSSFHGLAKQNFQKKKFLLSGRNSTAKTLKYGI